MFTEDSEQAPAETRPEGANQGTVTPDSEQAEDNSTESTENTEDNSSEADEDSEDNA